MSFLVVLSIIFRTIRRRAAVGRIEILYFLIVGFCISSDYTDPGADKLGLVPLAALCSHTPSPYADDSQRVATRLCGVGGPVSDSRRDERRDDVDLARERHRRHASRPVSLVSAFIILLSSKV